MNFDINMKYIYIFIALIWQNLSLIKKFKTKILLVPNNLSQLLSVVLTLFSEVSVFIIMVHKYYVSSTV